MSHSRNLTRRACLKMAGLAGIAASGLFKVTKSLAANSTERPDELKAFKGHIVLRSNPRYLEWFWAMSWYRIKPQRFPAIIAQPTDKDDLQLLMKYTAKAGLAVTFRSSGHNISLAFLQDGVVTIDMSLFTDFQIDFDNQTAWAEPGVLSETLNKATYKKGLAFPSAHTGFVTIGGYLLGGGMGWNMPEWGMGCGSVIGAEVMLATGEIVTISEYEHADLFWAMRGAGSGFFAAVLRYRLNLHKAPKVVKNTYFFTLDQIESAAAEMLRLLPASNQRTEVLCAVGNFPPPGGDKDGWYWAVSLMSYGETVSAAKDAADVFRNSGLPALSTVRIDDNEVLDYLDLYHQLKTDFYAQYRTTEMAVFTEEPGKVVRMVAERFSGEAVDSRSFGFCVLGTNPTVPEPCSFTYSAPHYVSWYLMGSTNEDVKANYALLDKIHDELKPYIKGYNINEIDLAHDESLAKQCFSDCKWEKLLEVRKAYDPEKRFKSYIDTFT